jgi:hypothetical protein
MKGRRKRERRKEGKGREIERDFNRVLGSDRCSSFH